MSSNRQYVAISSTRLLACLVSLLYACIAAGEESQSQGIPNVEIHSAYENGNVIVYTFRDGKLGYEFTAGPIKGAFNSNLEFESRRIADDIYLVSWHDTNNAFYMTLVLDLKNNKEHFTSIIGYANDAPRTEFLEAEIIRVTYLEP